jgi:hypothetical protein
VPSRHEPRDAPELSDLGFETGNLGSEVRLFRPFADERSFQIRAALDEVSSLGFQVLPELQLALASSLGFPEAYFEFSEVARHEVGAHQLVA